jgi:type IV pilus biogenesis protein CpaD/CtpE
MKPRRSILFAAVCTLPFAAGCGGPDLVNTAKLPDNYLCAHMKDVCKEAREFEIAYGKMSPAERKDAENVLKAYRMQCNDAVQQCTKSAKTK